MDTASSQPGELTLPLPSAASPTELPPLPPPELSFRPEPGSPASSAGRGGEAQSAAAEKPATLSPTLLEDLYQAAQAETLTLTREEFAAALATIGAKYNYNQPLETNPTETQQAAFYRSLRLPELALAQACALGRDPAWQRFLTLYRAPLTHAAIAIAGSATLGHDLADSLYAELFGLSTTKPSGTTTLEAPTRRSPLASYSGRGSLLGWLRTTLAQRHIDHHRRTRRETSLEALEDANPNSAPMAAPAATPTPLPAQLSHLTHALTRTLTTLDPESRFFLSAYFLDQQTLLHIARILHVHEATVSRKLKRLTADLRKQLLRNLQAGHPSGNPPALSKRAAEEALGADPRDLEINLRTLLQTSQSPPFSAQQPGTQHSGTQQPGAP